MNYGLRNSPYYVARALCTHLQKYVGAILDEELSYFRDHLAEQALSGRPELTIQFDQIQFRTAPELLRPPSRYFFLVLPQTTLPKREGTEMEFGLPRHGGPSHDITFSHDLILYGAAQNTSPESGLSMEEARDVEAQAMIWAAFLLLTDQEKTNLLKSQSIGKIGIGQLAFGRSSNSLPGKQPIFTSYGALHLQAFTQ